MFVQIQILVKITSGHVRLTVFLIMLNKCCIIHRGCKSILEERFLNNGTNRCLEITSCTIVYNKIMHTLELIRYWDLSLTKLLPSD